MFSVLLSASSGPSWARRQRSSPSASDASVKVSATTVRASARSASMPEGLGALAREHHGIHAAHVASEPTSRPCRARPCGRDRSHPRKRDDGDGSRRSSAPWTGPGRTGRRASDACPGASGSSCSVELPCRSPASGVTRMRATFLRPSGRPVPRTGTVSFTSSGAPDLRRFRIGARRAVQAAIGTADPAAPGSGRPRTDPPALPLERRGSADRRPRPARALPRRCGRRRARWERRVRSCRFRCSCRRACAASR